MSPRNHPLNLARQRLLWVSAFLVFVLWIGLPAIIRQAEAHDVRFPRVMQISFYKDGLRVGYGMTEHAGPRAAVLRSRFDADGSAVLDEEEKQELASWLFRSSMKSFQIELDGVPLQPELVDLKIELAGDAQAVEGDAIRVTAMSLLAIQLLPGRHRLKIADKPANPRLLLPFRLDLPRGWSPENVRSEGEALPLSPAGPFSWQATFAGLGGGVELDVLVVDAAETDSGKVGSSQEFVTP
ncbi:MAG: hypothetical protein VX498_04810 [Myxococcota bacterium]|nr:hypothetical protein [Myxococcota bacterium]